MKTVEDIKRLREASKELSRLGIPQRTVDKLDRWIDQKEQEVIDSNKPRPKCPNCGVEIDALNGCASASVPLSAYIDNEGTLHIDTIDGLKLRDLISDFDSPDGWFCPNCNTVLFGDDPYEHGKMERFLIGTPEE